MSKNKNTSVTVERPQPPVKRLPVENGPSTTGEKSGKGRGNNPPKPRAH